MEQHADLTSASQTENIDPSPEDEGEDERQEFTETLEAARFAIFQNLGRLKPSFCEDPAYLRQNTEIVRLLTEGLELCMIAEQDAVAATPRALVRQAYWLDVRYGGGWEAIAKESPAAARALQIMNLNGLLKGLVQELREEGQPRRPPPKIAPHRKSDEVA